MTACTRAHTSPIIERRQRRNVEAIDRVTLVWNLMTKKRQKQLRKQFPELAAAVESCLFKEDPDV